MTEQELKGFEGWLGLFPIMFVILLIALFFQSLNIFKNVIYIIPLSVAIYGIFVFTLFCKKDTRFLKHIGIYFWLNLGINFILSIIAWSHIGYKVEMLGEVFIWFIFSIGNLAVWVSYFKRSKRVKNTFGGKSVV